MFIYIINCEEFIYFGIIYVIYYKCLNNLEVYLNIYILYENELHLCN
jgi:hypothetical protein